MNARLLLCTHPSSCCALGIYTLSLCTAQTDIHSRRRKPCLQTVMTEHAWGPCGVGFQPCASYLAASAPAARSATQRSLLLMYSLAGCHVRCMELRRSLAMPGWWVCTSVHSLRTHLCVTCEEAQEAQLTVHLERSTCHAYSSDVCAGPALQDNLTFGFDWGPTTNRFVFSLRKHISGRAHPRPLCAVRLHLAFSPVDAMN